MLHCVRLVPACSSGPGLSSPPSESSGDFLRTRCPGGPAAAWVTTPHETKTCYIPRKIAHTFQVAVQAGGARSGSKCNLRINRLILKLHFDPLRARRQ
jgi:hypothetical protein